MNNNYIQVHTIYVIATIMPSLFKNSCTSPRLHHSSCLVYVSVLIIFSSNFLLVDSQSSEISCAWDVYRAVSVVEDQPAGTIVTTVAERIPGYLISPNFTSGRQRSVYGNYFDDNPDDWTVRTIARVDRDEMARLLMAPTSPVIFNVSFFIVDINYQMLDNITCIHLTLNVIDINNNAPRFMVNKIPLIIRIKEGVVNAGVSLPTAIDADEGINSTTNYTLVNGLGIFRLELRYQEGRISRVLLQNNVSLDAEQQVTYNLIVIASEGNEDPDYDELYVMIIPDPVCDETPYFPMSHYYVSVEEESPSGTIVFSNLTAIDHDIGHETLTYEIIEVFQVDTAEEERNSATVHPFVLDRETGVLTLHSEIDREEYLQYEIDVRVVDSCLRLGTATVVIELKDINDNAPTVSCSLCYDTISEANMALSVAFLEITDADTGENGNVSVQVFENRTEMFVPSSNFYLDINSDDNLAQLKRRITFDYEQEQMYHIMLNASDHGTPQRYYLYNLTITVEDYNDNPPVIDPIDPVYPINENPPINSEILLLNATDLDSEADGNGIITFSLPENHGAFQYQHLFRIEENTGRLLVAGTLDREQQESLSVLVSVTDNPARHRALSATVVVNISLNDLNDYTPNITFPIGSITISEEHIPNTVAFTVTAVDLDTPQYSNVVYSLVSNSAPFQINPTSGDVSLLGHLDFETTQSYTLQIRAFDGALAGVRDVTIMVRDENDEPPVIYANPSMPAILEGQAPVFVANISAIDPDTPQADLEFTIGSGNELGHFHIDPNTGQISTLTKLDKESVDFYNLTIRVFDGRQYAVEDELVVAVIDINDNIPKFIGEPFRFSIAEGMPRDSHVDNVVARDRDTGRNAVIRFSIVEVIPAFATPWFSINPMTGEITTNEVLDREFEPPPGVPYNGLITVQVAARDNSSQLQNDTFVKINISDVNDEGPMFSDRSVSIILPESTATGFPFHQVQAIDRDQYPNNQIIYSIPNRFPKGITERIRIDPNTGYLSLITTLDYETETRVNFVVRAQDAEYRDRSDDLSVSINVTGSQECDFKFVGLPTLANVTEESPPDTTIAIFEATDMEGTPIPSPGVQYTITTLNGTPSRFFGANLIRGRTQANLHTLVGGRDLDRETLANQPSGTTLQVNITASVINLMGECTLSSIVTVTILDRNDNAPTVSCSLCYGTISEVNMALSVAFLEITDADTGENGNVSVQVFENRTGMFVPSSNFYLDVSSDDNLAQLKRRITFDYEQEQMYHIMLNVSDHGTPQRYYLYNLTITVEDYNDNPPVIDPIDPVYPINENPPIDSEILQLNATDLDSVAGGNGIITFSLPENHGAFQYQHLFRIEENTGHLLVAGTLDREQQESLSVLVSVTDNPARHRALSATVVVNISLNDLNDYTPNITFPIGSITISEEHIPNTVAFTVTAVDLDTPQYSNVVYSLVSNSAPFQINPTSGDVSLLGHLDFETTQSYTLQIRAFDGALAGVRDVTIMVRDENDEPPVIYANPSMPAILEGQAPVFVANISAIDPDTPQADLEFTIGSGNELGHFRIDPNTGQIYTLTKLDKESVDFYNLTIRVFDGRQYAVEDELVVAVIDINDNIPEFIGEPFRFSIAEGMPRDSHVDNVVARDRDTGRNAVIRFSIAEVIPAFATPWFSINPMTGEITTNEVLDREFKPPPGVPYNGLITVQVAARDNSSQLQIDTFVEINISDVNDEGPMFSDRSVSIILPESTATGFPFHQVQAIDRDQYPNNQIIYSISNRFPEGITKMIHIDLSTGYLSLITTLDYETETRINFVVRAQDAEYRDRSDDLSVSINVTGSQECDFKFVGLPTLANVTEESPPDTTIAIFEATDMEGTPIPSPGVQYTITTLNGTPSRFFGANLIRGRTQANLHTLVGRRDLDREILASQPSGTTLQVNITASIINLMGECTLSSIVTVTILDRNDNAPTFSNSSYQFSILENNHINAEVGRISASDPDLEDNGMITFSIEDSVPFSINNNGVITALSSLDHDGPSQTYEFRVIARDRGMLSMSSSAVVRVNVLDENDNFPVFSLTQNRTFEVREDTPVNTVIAVINVTDADSGSFGTITLTGLELDSHFTLISNGSLILVYPLDGEKQTRYSFIVRAEDGGKQVTTANVSIFIDESANVVNNEPPFFEQEDYIFYVNNGGNIGDVVGTVVAMDPDENSQIVYKLLVPTPYFSIDNLTGNIILTNVISIEDSPYNLTVAAFNPGLEHLKSVASVSVVVVTSSPLTFIAIASGVTGGAAIVTIILLCSCIVCICHKSRVRSIRKLEVDDNGAHLKNLKPILKTLPTMNGQQRSVKFNTTVEETHYDPSGIEHSVIHKESNTISGDNSPQTSLGMTDIVPNSAMNTNSPEIVDYDMSLNLGIDTDILPHHRPQYPHHDRKISPIMLQEELNPFEFTQSSGSDSSEDVEAESTFSNRPSNFNVHFGRQIVQDEVYSHPADLGHYAPPTPPPDKDLHLPPMHHIQLMARNAQYTSSSHIPSIHSTEDIQDRSLNVLPCNINHGSIDSSILPQRRIQHHYPSPSITCRSPPFNVPHNMVTPAPSNGRTNSRDYLHPLLSEASHSFTDYGESLTYFESTEPKNNIEHQPPPVSMSHNIVTSASSKKHTNSRDYASSIIIPDFSNRPNVINYISSVRHQESGRDQSTQTCSDTSSTVNSDPVNHNLPGNYSQISTTTNSSGSSVDHANLMLLANIEPTNRNNQQTDT